MQLSAISLALTRIYGGGFSPSKLFANNEVGAWYDPSDLTTMFQDSAGTTPVTADGQPVGLILDKSKGLVLGPELVTNGTFDTNLSGWTNYGGDGASVVSGRMRISLTAGGGGFTGGRYQDISVTPGTYQKVSVSIETTVISGGTQQVDVFLYDGAGFSSALAQLSQNTVGSKTVTLFVKPTASVVRVYCRVYCDPSTTVTAFFDNISVKELPGNHASQSTAASRPLKTSTGAADWTNYDAVDDVLNTTFPSSLGSDCTVCRANVGGAPTILTGQTIGTSYADSTDNAGLIIINRALTGQETTDVTAWLTAKGAT